MSGTITEPIYCSQQIVIPPTFPHVLKLFAKAAIRTQPYDLLLWSATYFRALSEERVPPVKERLEYPLIRSEGGLSPQYLKILIRQLSNSEDIHTETLTKRWLGVCLQEKELKEILCTAGVYMTESFPLYKFAAVAAGFLCKSLTQTMIMLCEIFTDEPDGGSAAISADFFVDLYSFLAVIDALSEVTYYDGYREEIYMANEATKKDIVVLVEEPPEEITLAPKDSERWIPKLNRWSTLAQRSTVFMRNTILDEAVPAEGGKVSRNLANLNRPPREKFTDPHRSSLEEGKGDNEEADVGSEGEQETTTELAEATEAQKPEEKGEETKKGGAGDQDSEEEDEKKEEKTEESADGAAGDQATEGDKAEIAEKTEIEQTTEQPKEVTTEETETKKEGVKQDNEDDEDESEEGGEERVDVIEEEEEKKLGRDHGVILRVYSEDGEKIESVSVVDIEEKEGSEAGSEDHAEHEVNGAEDKEAVENPEEETKEAASEEGGSEDEEEGWEMGSEGSPDKMKGKKGEEKGKKPKDVSVKERAEIIELIEKTQEKKVNDFLDVIDSIENLAEKTKMLTYDADKLGGRELAVKSGEIVAETVERELLGRVERPEKQDPHADAKGVVYPVLGEFFHEFFEIVGEVKDLHIPDVIVVPGKPGIGAVVAPAMLEEVLRYVRETAADQCDMFMPRDLRHCLCPPLERHLSVESFA